MTFTITITITITSTPTSTSTRTRICAATTAAGTGTTAAAPVFLVEPRSNRAVDIASWPITDCHWAALNLLVLTVSHRGYSGGRWVRWRGDRQNIGVRHNLGINYRSTWKMTWKLVCFHHGNPSRPVPDLGYPP